MDPHLLLRNNFKLTNLNTRNLEEIIELATCPIKSIGFDCFAFAMCGSIPFMRPEINLFGNYPTEWLQHYKKNNYAVIDPTVQHCRVSIEPLRWSEELFTDCPKLWLEANSFKLNHGVVQPIFNARGSIGFLALAREIEMVVEDELDKLKPIIKAFADIVGARAFELMEPLTSTHEVEFNAKEKAVLRWTADGKTSEEIGLILGVTPDTVNFHLRNIQKRIGACNRLQAATYAVAHGYI